MDRSSWADRKLAGCPPFSALSHLPLHPQLLLLPSQLCGQVWSVESLKNKVYCIAMAPWEPTPSAILVNMLDGLVWFGVTSREAMVVCLLGFRTVSDKITHAMAGAWFGLAQNSKHHQCYDNLKWLEETRCAVSHLIQENIVISLQQNWAKWKWQIGPRLKHAVRQRKQIWNVDRKEIQLKKMPRAEVANWAKGKWQIGRRP